MDSCLPRSTRQVGGRYSNGPQVQIYRTERDGAPVYSHYKNSRIVEEDSLRALRILWPFTWLTLIELYRRSKPPDFSLLRTIFLTGLRLYCRCIVIRDSVFGSLNHSGHRIGSILANPASAPRCIERSLSRSKADHRRTIEDQQKKDVM